MAVSKTTTGSERLRVIVGGLLFFFLRMSGLVLETDKLGLRIRRLSSISSSSEMDLLPDKKEKCGIPQLLGVRKKKKTTKISNRQSEERAYVWRSVRTRANLGRES